MGSNLSREESTVLSAWKALLRSKGIKITDDALRSMLLWAKSQNLCTDINTAFSVRQWKAVGDRLWDVISQGDKAAVNLATTWRQLYDVLREWRMKQKVQREPGQGTGAGGQQQMAEVRSGAVPLPGGQPVGVASVGASSGSADAGTERSRSNTTRYLSPRDRVQPVYPSPAQQELNTRRKYLPPARQLAELTLRETQAQPSAPPLSSESGEGTELFRVSAPLPDSSRDDDELPEMRNSDQKRGSASRKSRSRSKLAAPWTLPSCEVSVVPLNPAQFWESVKEKAMEMCDGNLIEKPGLPATTNAPSADTDVVSNDHTAFPAPKAIPNTGQNYTHKTFSWGFVKSLLSKVARFGVNSPEVMQLVHVINVYRLAPRDIRHLAMILFEPVLYDTFQHMWRELVESAALNNMKLPQQHPCHGVGVDALMGTGPFDDPQLQAQWDPLVLAQAQQIGISALIKAMELAPPKQKCFTPEEQGWGMAQCPKNNEQKMKAKTNLSCKTICNRCGKSGHYTKQCKQKAVAGKLEEEHKAVWGDKYANNHEFSQH
ncbi:uncharacterized protein LOC117244433 [Parus major]|uniref:uncharacterized protein LOC117244433 n=1 Tax=Parus major TaxID=9157 RepID=UPI0007711FAF|nr:uncharacterized protein LOC117244433 [Parus major]